MKVIITLPPLSVSLFLSLSSYLHFLCSFGQNEVENLKGRDFTEQAWKGRSSGLLPYLDSS